MLRMLALSMSPRKGGNSDTLLGAFIEGAGINYADVRHFHTHKMDISPCTGCGACESTGECIIRDDFDTVREELILADCIVFATPLYFMNVPARGKAFIDRCQMFWTSKHRLKQDLFEGRQRFGILLACAGAQRGPRGSDVFRGLKDTMTYVYDALGLIDSGSLLVPGVDAPDDVRGNKGILDTARDLGNSIAVIGNS